MSQIEKQQFQNTTQGWVGVTVIGPRGDDRGAAVEPGGNVWLSEQEQVLTANAHRRAEDNPFIEQTLLRTNPETGEQEEIKVTPLVPISEQRYVPAQDRFIPGVDGRPGAVAQQVATDQEPVVVNAERKDATTRHAEVAAQGDDAQPNVPPPAPTRAAAAAAAAQAEADAQAQADQNPPLPPSLTPEAPVVPTPPEAPQESPQAPQTGEEHAAQVDQSVGEETGAAPPPSGDAPEGEYAQAEEVGTPVGGSVGSPSAERGSDTEADPDQPAPFSPPEE